MNIDAETLEEDLTTTEQSKNGRLATQHQTKYSKDVDVKSLEAELKNAIKGEVRFDKD